MSDMSHHLRKASKALEEMPDCMGWSGVSASSLLSCEATVAVEPLIELWRFCKTPT